MTINDAKSSLHDTNPSKDKDILNHCYSVVVPPEITKNKAIVATNSLIVVLVPSRYSPLRTEKG